MATPTIASNQTNSNISLAQPARPSGPPPEPARSADQRRGGVLGTLFKLNRPRKPVDFKAKLDADVERVIPGTGAKFDPHALGVEGSMGDKPLSLGEIKALFIDDISDEFAEDLLDLRSHSDLPIYGNAPRYAHGLVLACALAEATGGDASRAEAVVRAWQQRGNGATPETLADDLAVHCLLARTDIGWDLMEALPGSRFVTLADSDAQRPRIDTALKTCGHLLQHLEFGGGMFQRPRTLEEAAEIAREIVAQGAPDENEPWPSADPAYRYRDNILAARALLGALSNTPSPREREAMFVFGGNVDNAEKLAATGSRINRLLGRSGDKPSWWARVRGRAGAPASEQQLMDSLAQEIIADLTTHIDARLGSPTRMENGRRVADDTDIPLNEQRVRDAVHLAALKAASDQIKDKSWRDEVKLKSGQRKQIVDIAAKALRVTPQELRTHPAWEAAYAECATVDATKLRAWLADAGIDPADSTLGQRLHRLNDLSFGMASRADGFSELIDTLRPRSMITFTGHGTMGPNNTLWATLAPVVLAHKTGEFTVTPLPTGAKLRGRGAAVLLSAEERADGAYVDIDIGTFDRKTFTWVLGMVPQVHNSDAFWWNVFEYGRHHHKQTAEGAKLRIKADTLDEAKARACALIETMSDVKSGDGDDAWSRLVNAAYDDKNVCVYQQTRKEKEGVGITQIMSLVGANVPVGSNIAVPKNDWVSWGVNKTWGALGGQWSRTKGKTTSVEHGANDEAGSAMRREQHLRGGPLAYPVPSGTFGTHLGMGISGGHGAWWMPLKQITQLLEHEDTRLHMPPPGTNGVPFQEMTFTEATFREWVIQPYGPSQPAPSPDLLDLVVLPDPPAGVKGTPLISVRRDLKPEAAAQLRARLDKIETLRGGGEAAGPAILRESDQIRALMCSEASWGAYEVWAEYTDHRMKITGPLPFIYEARAHRGTVVRKSEHLAGRQGGRNTVFGSRFPEKAVPDIHNQRVLERNQPVMFAPPLPRVPESAMQQTIREIFAAYPKEWVPVDPQVLPSHMQRYGQMFELVQMRRDVYPRGTEIGDRLDEYLKGPDGMAAVDCDPRFDPEENMRKYTMERDLYIIREWPKRMGENEPLPKNFDGLPLEFFNNFDIATFFADNFHPPRRPLAHFQPAPQRTLREFLTLMRHINRLDMSAETLRLNTSAIPLPEIGNVPSNRFILQFGWDELLSILGALADGDIEGAMRSITNKCSIIERMGIDLNANATHYTGRSQPLSLALLVEATAARLAETDPERAKQFRAQCLPALMMEFQATLRGAGDLAHGRIFNGVAMKPDGDIVLGLVDYGGRGVPRPEGFYEDREMADEAFDKHEINRPYTYTEARLGATIGTDFNNGQRKPKTKVGELNFSAPLQMNAHMVRSVRVIVDFLEEGGHYDMAKLMRQYLGQFESAIQRTFFEERDDLTVKKRPAGVPPSPKLKMGSYYRLREGELHPLLSAEIANALWANLVPPEGIEWAVNSIKSLMTPEGIMATADVKSEQQWDGKNFWAMHAYKAVIGLMNYGYDELAEELAVAFVGNALEAYRKHGKTAEKYGPNGRLGKGGEYPVEANMTMTNEALILFGSMFESCAKLLDEEIVFETAPASAPAPA